LVVGLAVLVGVGAVAFAGWLATRPKRFDYGTRKGEIMQMDEAFEKAPCDKKPTLQFVRTLSSLGDYRGVLEHTDEFFAKCGDWPRLRWLSEGAHDHLKEYDAAIADATKLIDGAPNDQDYWWWRGQAKEHKGDLDGAIADMRRSLELLPKATNIAANLARVLEQKGLRCDARDTLLAFIDHRPAAAGYPWVQTELARLGEGCPKLNVQTFPAGEEDDDSDERERD
jgi:aspartyl protease family protein